MQFQTSDGQPNRSQVNCLLPTTLSDESGTTSGTCVQQRLFGRTNRVVHPSPRLVRFWRNSCTSRHELLFFPNDELDWQSEEEDDSCVVLEQDPEDEGWEQVGQTANDVVDKGSASESTIIPLEQQQHISSDNNCSDWESSLVSEEHSVGCGMEELVTENKSKQIGYTNM